VARRKSCEIRHFGIDYVNYSTLQGTVMRTVVIVTLLLIVTTCSAEEYTIKTEDAGRFSVLHYDSDSDKADPPRFKTSSLRKQTIIANDPKCVVQLKSQHNRLVSRSELEHYTQTTMHVTAPVAAIRLHVMVFDVFGLYRRTLVVDIFNDFNGATQPYTHKEGFEVEWSSLWNDLTVLTYVERVRLADGTQWVADVDSLSKTLTKEKHVNITKQLRESEK
jgi:hypothetical protein